MDASTAGVYREYDGQYLQRLPLVLCGQASYHLLLLIKTSKIIKPAKASLKRIAFYYREIIG
ncbi:MAG: hypothetical protein C0407_03320 [Desulfobacca sp.]|nr:hypothetical protein [Desulfobacca sp.]